MPLIAALMDPGAYPEPTASVALVQTHISWVFLTEGFAYKVKKPVDLEFLNFTTLRRRHYYLNQELILNRRLCPEIYLKVLPIVARRGGVEMGGRGHPVEYALKMVRMPQERMMDEVAARGELTREHLDGIIARLVPFYEAAATGPRINRYGEPAIIRYNQEENFAETAPLVGAALPRELFEEVRTFSREFLARHRDLFKARVAAGRIRDCHGDLHLRNICLADHIHIFDCIEFNPRFRYGDVAGDIDFLAMDLDFRGLGEFSAYFVRRFAEASGDAELPVLLDFYKCYRAYVRGKISLFTAQGPDLPREDRGRALVTARAYFDLAGAYAREGSW